MLAGQDRNMSAVFPVTADPRYRLSTAVTNQTAFSVPFPFLATADITAYKIGLDGLTTLLSYPTNYTLTGAGNPAGGTLTLKLGAQAGQKLLIVGTASRARGNSVVRGGKFDSKAIDEDLDRLTIITQELDREMARTVRAAYGATPASLTPGVDGTLAVWQADGELGSGPDADVVFSLDAALAVDAGRALIYPAAPAAEKYNAHSRIIENVLDGVAPQDAATRAQLDAAIAGAGLAALQASIDALTLTVAAGWKTGDLKLAMSDDAQTGWLKVNGQTIGDASSGGTARANADAHDLFVLIWAKYSNTLAPIQTSAGAGTSRGISAEADWAAHRRLPLLATGGEFIRILDGGRGIDTGRVLGSAQGELIKNHIHPFAGTAVPPHTHTTTLPHSHGLNGDSIPRWSDGDTGGGSHAIATSSAGGHTPAGTIGNPTSGGGAETRPRNIAFPLFVKL
jgi:hypothetical protein